MPRTSSPNGTARPLSLGLATEKHCECWTLHPTWFLAPQVLTPGPDPGVTSASTTMDITTIDGELSSHSPTTMYTSITAGPYPGVTHALTTTDIAIIAGVIAVVVIVLVCLLFVLLHYMYRHKGTYHTNEAKGTEFAESADAALQGDPALQDAGDNSRKEYFI
ncbi:glycophorin-C isoform X1 [Papio anubis]|uniref:glycophorin-C isoform X1 n=1 Tax=Papio anubis TaxID=9555 RepID=UPI0012ADF75E|nr:glycophorin-C isoform X1 [Papio anubis]